MSASPVVLRWAKVRREILEGVKRNQPAPYERFVVACSMASGLSNEKVKKYLNEFEKAKLIRRDPQGRLQLEEGAEAMLGFK